MTNTLKIADDLYLKPPINALGGARWSFRKATIATTDLISTQLLALNVLPAGHRLVNAFVEATDMDTGTSPALTISVGVLNTYLGEAEASASAAADYDSGGATNTDTDPKLVSGQNIVTTVTIGQTGGRAVAGLSTTSMILMPSKDIGVDKTKDRIIAVQFPTVPATAAAGIIVVGIEIDRDQE
jgi:hypothetical protein